jgi:hypothetical protein
MSDFKAALANWVRDATYAMPGSDVADMLEDALSAIRPPNRPVVLRSGRRPVAATAVPTPPMAGKRRGRPKAQPKPEVDAGPGDGADA